MEPIQGSETSAFNNNQTPGKYPEELLSSGRDFIGVKPTVQWVPGDLSPEEKSLRNRSLPIISICAQMRNKWSDTFTLPIFLYSVYRDHFTLTMN